MNWQHVCFCKPLMISSGFNICPSGEVVNRTFDFCLLTLLPFLHPTNVTHHISSHISMCSTLTVCWSSLRVDYERIKAVGPDRAAAEWLLRCGAKVRFQGFDRWHLDYNALPTGSLGRYKIQAIDATESCIMYKGFDYLGQCGEHHVLVLDSLTSSPNDRGCCLRYI